MSQAQLIEPVWGSAAIDPRSHDLPGLKLRYLLDRLPEAGSVLEIGCGEGKILRSIAQFRPRLALHGSDIRQPRALPGNITFHSVAEQGALPDASFDAVLIVDVLEHVPDPSKMLREAKRLLRAGGTLLAFVPVEGEVLSFYTAFRGLFGADLYVRTKDHVQAFTHAGLIGVVSRDFEVHDVQYAYHGLGQFMDASFFALTELPALRRFWWRENTYYNPENANSSLLSSGLNQLLRLGNWIAWCESKALAKVRTGAAGVLFCAAPRSKA
jgi:SAM-dependent methyltransferase